MQKVERYKAEPHKSPVKKLCSTDDQLKLAEPAIQTDAAMSDKEKLRESDNLRKLKNYFG